MEILPIARRGGAALRSAGAMPIATRLAVAGVVGGAIFSILLLRLWAMTVLSGSQYAELAQQNQIRQVPVEAPRGTIMDRKGRLLVTNRAAREVVLNLRYVPAERRPALYTNLSHTLGISTAEIRKRVERGAVDLLTPIVIAEDVTDDTKVFYLEEHNDDFPGIQIRDRFVRNYVGGSVAAHMLGQVGEVSPAQLESTYADRKSGDRVGVSGLEYRYDGYLRGVDGYRAVEVDASGVLRGQGRGVPAQPGSNLRLSLDRSLQRATEKALVEGITIAHRSPEGARAYAGAAVAMDVNTGEVLSLASYPTYDPNIFVSPGHDSEITAALTNRRSPMTNRAIGGLYPPGSTYKVVTGMAAMSEGFIRPATLLECPASMNVLGTTFNNWTKDLLPAMDMATALEVSCDTYFYQIGRNFYGTPFKGDTPQLQAWSRRFGLGASTGIDLPGEEEGLVPTPKWRRETFKGVEGLWGPGKSINLSIGQGDLLVTPLQMTSIYAAIANGGTLHEPRIGRRVEDPGGKEMLTLARGGSTRLNITEPRMRAIRNGLYRAAHSPNGTSSAVFASFEVKVSGKTGTAEKPPNGDMAWYCGYAPAANPTIAACAIIESGGHGGTAAAPVVLRMFQQWFGAKGGNITTARPTD